RAVAVMVGVRGFLLLRLFPLAGIGLLDHPFAEVDADEVLLKNVVVEHELGRLAEIHDPLPERRRPHAVRHLLRITRTGGVVVAADAADAAGDEVRVARVLALHEDAVAAKGRRRAETLGDLLLLEVDPRVQAHTADDAGYRISDLFH